MERQTSVQENTSEQQLVFSKASSVKTVVLDGGNTGDNVFTTYQSSGFLRPLYSAWSAPGTKWSEMMPRKHEMAEGAYGGLLIQVQGSVLLDANRFNVNLQCGRNDDDDIIFHMDFRFNHMGEENCVICNDYLNKTWGSSRQKHVGMPLTRGEKFDIALVFERSYIKVLVNGTHFTDFRSRIPLQRATHFTIFDQAKVTLVEFKEIDIEKVILSDS